MTLAMLLSGSEILAQGKGNGNGNGGGGGGDSAASFVIAKLDNANGAFSHGHANDLNNLREVVGSVDQAAAFWTVTDTNGTIQTQISVLAGGKEATGINDSSEIVGLTYDEWGNWTAVYWASPSAAPIDQPTLPGSAVSRPNSISNDGVICGYVALNAQDWDSTARAVAWRVTTVGGNPVISDPVELPAPANSRSIAQSVNDNDADGVAQIVGFYRETFTSVQWDVMSMPDGSLLVGSTLELLPLDGALAVGITNNGGICGRTNVDAIIWGAGAYAILDRPKGRNRVPRAWAWDISDSGIIVGEAGELYEPRACFWSGGDGSLTYFDGYIDTNS